MPDDIETIHRLGDFIQQRAQGAVIRHWLELEEDEQVFAMERYRHQSSISEVENMVSALLHVAAGYPSCDVRKKLVRTYALFLHGIKLDKALS